MRKPLTGEPCAGKPHARFGGRGGAGLLYPYPVHTQVLPQVFGQLMGDLLQRFVLEFTDRRFIAGQGAIKPDFIFGQTQLFTPVSGLMEFLGHLHQLFLKVKSRATCLDRTRGSFFPAALASVSSPTVVPRSTLPQRPQPVFLRRNLRQWADYYAHCTFGMTKWSYTAR